MNHYKEIPINQPGWLMESNKGFFRGSDELVSPTTN